MRAAFAVKMARRSRGREKWLTIKKKADRSIARACVRVVIVACMGAAIAQGYKVGLYSACVGVVCAYI
jgi:hypothetical protein